MAEAGGSAGRGKAWPAALAALVAGAAAGWVAGRLSARTVPPPPPVYRNPLRDARKGESLSLLRNDGTRVMVRVLEEDLSTVLLDVEQGSPGVAPFPRRVRVSRTFFGVFALLEGDDVPRDASETSLRDFSLEKMEPEDIAVPGMGRTFHAWKFTGAHRTLGPMTIWVSDELPVHGLVRMDTPRTKTEVTGFSTGP